LLAFLSLAAAVGLLAWVAWVSVREITDPDRFGVCPALSPGDESGKDDQQLARPGAPTPGSCTSVVFWKDVCPVLEKRGLSCHGPKRQKAGFRVDRREDFFGEGGRDPQAIPGDSARSPLMAIVAGVRKDMARADAHRLSAREVALVRGWIDRGAERPEKPGREC
jgi:hypothetical protein